MVWSIPEVCEPHVLTYKALTSAAEQVLTGMTQPCLVWFTEYPMIYRAIHLESRRWAGGRSF